MSTQVGIIGERQAPPGYIDGLVIVYASAAGVEVHADKDLKLSTEETRKLIDLLQRAIVVHETLRVKQALTADAP